MMKNLYRISLKKKYFKTLQHLNIMPFEDRRVLLQAIFENKKLNGQRLGVHLKRGKNWIFTIKGALIDVNGYVPKSASDQLDYAKAILGSMPFP